MSNPNFTAMRAAPWVGPLAVTVLVQISLAFLTRVVPVIGPVVTDSAGVSPESIGHLAALNTVGVMVFLVCGSPVLHRLGPVRSLQIGALIGSLGLLVTLTANWPLLLFSSLLVGLAYGPSPPAGSDILARTAPPQHRGTIFSIKQAGVPVGGALAGLLVPWLTEELGWRWALTISALLSALVIAAIQPWRRTMDADRDRVTRITLRSLLSLGNVLRPFSALKKSRALIALSVAGFGFAIGQGSLFSFYVTFLNVEVGLSLTAAGTLFAISQAVSIFARVLNGWLADRLRSGARALLILAIGSGVMMIVTSWIAPGWSWPAMMVVSVLGGMTIGTWNGVYLSEVAANAEPGQVAEATSGATFLTFIGYVLAPVAFAAFVAYTGSYSTAFVLAGLPAFVSAAAMLWLLRKS